MGHKPVLVVLVVVAILVGVAIARGHHRDRTDPPPDPKNPPGQAFGPLDRFFGRFRDPLDVGRMIGCARADRILTTADKCGVVIVPGTSTVSTFTLKPVGGATVEACFALNPEQFDACVGKSGDNAPTKLDEGGSPLMVGRDSAFLWLHCLSRAGVGPCQVSVE